MAMEIRVPTLGESISEATVGRWFKKVGEAVKADEPLVELETDKVTLEVNAPAAGVLSEMASSTAAKTVTIGALARLAVGGWRRGRSQGGSLLRRPRSRPRRPRLQKAAQARARAGCGHAAFARRRQDRRRQRHRRIRHQWRRQARPGAEGRRAGGGRRAARRPAACARRRPPRQRPHDPAPTPCDASRPRPTIPRVKNVCVSPSCARPSRAG